MTQHGETVPVCFTAWWEPTTQSYKQMKAMNQPANRQVKRDGSEAAGEQQQRSWAAGPPPKQAVKSHIHNFFFSLSTLTWAEVAEVVVSTIRQVPG